MINRKLFAQQVMYLLEQDTYLRVSYVSSKLMVSKQTTRRILNAMVKDCILKRNSNSIRETLMNISTLDFDTASASLLAK